MSGGFTGAGAIPAVDRPMLVAMLKGVKVPDKKRKLVKEEAARIVRHLLGEA